MYYNLTFLLPTDVPDVHRFTVIYVPPVGQETIRYRQSVRRISGPRNIRHRPPWYIWISVHVHGSEKRFPEWSSSGRDHLCISGTDDPDDKQLEIKPLSQIDRDQLEEWFVEESMNFPSRVMNFDFFTSNYNG